MPESPNRSRSEITISWATLLKIFIACLLAYLVFRLWRLAAKAAADGLPPELPDGTPRGEAVIRQPGVNGAAGSA